MWRSGRRLFSAAAVLMLLTAAAHTAGNLAPHDMTQAERNLFAAMDAVHQPLGMGMNPSMSDIYWDLVLTMSVTFAALGILNLVLAGSREMPDQVLRRIAWLDVIWVAAFLLLNWHYRIPPSLISGLLIEAALIASLTRGLPRRDG